MRTPACQSVTQLVNEIYRGRVDYAVTFSMPNTMYYNQFRFLEDRVLDKNIPSEYEFPFQIENMNILLEINHFNYDNILPFLSVSLGEKTAEQGAFIDKCCKEYNVYGIKYHPFYDGKDILDLENKYDILDTIYKNDLPIICHTGDDECSNPKKVILFAKDNPGIRVCIAHMGGFDESVLKDGAELENVYFDCSPLHQMCVRMGKTGKKCSSFQFDNPDKLLSMISEILPNKLLWGTDFPWTYNYKMERIAQFDKFDYECERKTLDGLDKNTANRIANLNVKRFLFG